MSDVGLDNLRTVAEAVAVLDGTPVRPRVEQVALVHAAGRTLAVAVVADRDTPPFDKSLMDGYAVRSADTGPRRYTGEIAAGDAPWGALAAGECVAIMTGAPLPPGADAVVPVERTTRDGDRVTVNGPVRPGDSLMRRAAEAAAGDPLLAVGTRLGPAQLAVCAQVGAGVLGVFARPRVGVLSTGDEIVPHDATPAAHQVRNGNTPMLLSLLHAYGADPVDLGHAADDPDALSAKLATPGLDAVVVTGGMSMGTRDYTPRVLTTLGYELAVTKLKVKPGKPFVFARRRVGASASREDLRPAPSSRYASPPRRLADVPPFVFGLPGNPVSAFVCTVRLVSRLVLRAGGRPPDGAWVTAELKDALPPNGPREFYQPAALEDGVARVLAWRGSADLFTLARANALLCRPADQGSLSAGARVALTLLP